MQFILNDVLSATSEDWDQTLSIGIKGHALVLKHIIPLMRTDGSFVYTYKLKYTHTHTHTQSKQTSQQKKTIVIHTKTEGSIVNMGSISSVIAQPKFVTYSVTKAAMLQVYLCV